MKTKYFLSLLFVFSLLTSCQTKTEQHPQHTAHMAPRLDKNAANQLAKLPLTCIDQAYPYKLGQVLADSTDLKTPQALHPAFWGCFDWHSAVHAHWSLLVLIENFPIDDQQHIINSLAKHLTKANIAQEIAFFKQKENSSFERTYGWAWLLKLAQALEQSKEPQAKKLAENLSELTNLIIEKYITFLPKLVYPIRAGEHPNTAFGLSLAYDYALALNHSRLKETIEIHAKKWFINDQNCPLKWEPSGYDFLSPCLEEALLMSKILPSEEFEKWLQAFLPQLFMPDFALEVAQVADRTDGKLVHLDGLNFSRAWCFYGLAKKSQALAHLRLIADKHINASLPNLVNDSYEGGHWLGTFALLAILSQ